MHVLIVESEITRATQVRDGLIGAGMTADVVIGGEQALRRAASPAYDTVVLGVSLPGIDGFETCRRLRADGVSTPVLMLSARGATEDRVAGLSAGADDYVTKPFSFDELSARLRALARRGPLREDLWPLTVGALVLDPASRRARRGAADIALSAQECSLLEAFMRRPGEVLDRRELLEAAWDGESEHRSNVVDVYVGYLREKIDRPFDVESIQTVWGAGYRLRADGGRPIA